MEQGKQNGRLPSLCVVTGGVHPDFSGATMQVLLMLRELRKSGLIDPIILGITTHPECLGENKLEEMDCVRCLLDAPGIYGKIKLNARFALALWRCRRRFELLWVVGINHLTVTCTILAKLFRKPVIVESTMVYMEDPSGLSRSISGRIKLFFLRYADWIVTLSLSMHHSFLEHFSGPRPQICMIPNSVDSNRASPIGDKEKAGLRKDLGLPTKGYLVTNVGAIERRKGQDFLIECWAALKDSWRDGYLVLVGPDNSEPEFVSNLKDYIHRNNVRNVIFVGYSPRAIEILRASDMFVLASHMEGFPSVQMEAASCALPIVTIALPGITEMVFEDGVSALIINDRDTSKFSAAMERIRTEPGLAKSLGLRARAMVEDKFSLKKITGDYVRMFTQSVRPQSPNNG